MSEQIPQTRPRDSTRHRFNGRWIALGIAGGSVLLLAGLLIPRVLDVGFHQSVDDPSPHAAAAADFPVPTRVKVDASAAATGVLPPLANALGDPDAPVKLIEYADFQCPYCMRFWRETEPQIIEQYVKSGKVYYEYHSVGALLGPESGAAAQAAYCAGDQAKFWQYHDTLFSHWTGENVGDFTDDKLQGYAALISLDQAFFKDCLISGKYAARLEQDVQDAKAAGIRATPSFLNNGRLLEGALPFTSFQQAIEAALQGN